MSARAEAEALYEKLLDMSLWREKGAVVVELLAYGISRQQAALQDRVIDSVVQDSPTEHATDPARLACGCERAYGCSCYTRD